MTNLLKQFSDWLDKISLILAVIAISLILIISIYGAFFRYVLGEPLSWTLPVERILMVWAALFGIPAALKRGQHMGVEGLIRILPNRLEIILRYVGMVFMSLFVICLLWYGWLELTNRSDLYMISASVRISSVWIQAAIPVSAAIQLFHLLTAPYVIKAQMQPPKPSQTV